MLLLWSGPCTCGGGLPGCKEVNLARCATAALPGPAGGRCGRTPRPQHTQPCLQPTKQALQTQLWAGKTHWSTPPALLSAGISAGRSRPRAAPPRPASASGRRSWRLADGPHLHLLRGMPAGCLRCCTPWLRPLAACCWCLAVGKVQGAGRCQCAAARQPLPPDPLACWAAGRRAPGRRPAGMLVLCCCRRSCTGSAALSGKCEPSPWQAAGVALRSGGRRWRGRPCGQATAAAARSCRRAHSGAGAATGLSV